jgi:predicted molibdopterin-dependent oxidoreductase YjgC
MGYPKTRMDYPKRYYSIERVREEISELVPLYSELAGNGRETWIKEASRKKLFDSNSVAETIAFSPLVSSKEQASNESYPFTAILGSLRFHLGGGTRTGYSPRIRDFRVSGEVEISAEDGLRMHLKDGDRVKISSTWGSISRGVRLKRDLTPGLVFIPVAFHNNDAGHLIGLTQLGVIDTPGWKQCHVKLERA